MLRSITTAGLSGVERSVVKATFDDDSLPKSKHVQSLVEYVDDEMVGSGNSYLGPNTDIFTCISQRCALQAWRVVLKTMLVVHQLMRDADIIFCTELSGRRSEVSDCCINFFDQTSQESIIHSTFIRRYSKYVSVKIKVFCEVGFNVERKMDPKGGKDLFASYSPKQMMDVLPELMKQLETMTDCMPHLGGSFFIHDLSKGAMLLIIKDALRLYPALQLCLFQLLASFQDLSLDEAKWTLRMYEQYFQINRALKAWFERSVRLEIIDSTYVPNFNTLPESLAISLKEYVKDCEKKNRGKRESQESNGLPEMKNIEDILDEKQLAEAELGKSRVAFADLLGFEDLAPTRTQPSSMSSQAPQPVSQPSDLFSDASDWLSSFSRTSPPVQTAGGGGASSFAVHSSADDWFASQNGPVSSNAFPVVSSSTDNPFAAPSLPSHDFFAPQSVPSPPLDPFFGGSTGLEFGGDVGQSVQPDFGSKPQVSLSGRPARTLEQRPPNKKDAMFGDLLSF